MASNVLSCPGAVRPCDVHPDIEDVENEPDWEDDGLPFSLEVALPLSRNSRGNSSTFSADSNRIRSTSTGISSRISALDSLSQGIRRPLPCRAVWVSIPVVLLNILLCVLAFVVYDGRPFLHACRHGDVHGFDIDEKEHHDALCFVTQLSCAVQISSVVLAEGLACVWLQWAASTPFLRGLGWYVFLLWLHRWIYSLYTLVVCSDGFTPLQSVLALCSSFSFIAALIFSWYLAFDRMRTLELNMLQDLGRCLFKRCLLGLSALGVLYIIGQHFKMLESSGYVRFLLAISLVIVGLLVWMAALFRTIAVPTLTTWRAASAFRGRRRVKAQLAAKTAAVQLLGLTLTLFSTLFHILAIVMQNHFRFTGIEDGVSFFWFLHIFKKLDYWANLIGALALSGALTGAVKGGRQLQSQEASRLRALKLSRQDFIACADQTWTEKVEELAYRGVTLEALLKFYKQNLRTQMPDFDPSRHRTIDVVRRAIIPLSRQSISSYATVMMEGKPTQPNKMVTHTWSGLFRDLLAAIVADVLDEDEYDPVANLLDHDFATVEEWVKKLDAGHQTYWVCAFAINHHCGICASNPNGDADPLTGIAHAVCDCGAPKYFNLAEPLYEGKSIPCEMNKFNDMLGFLSANDLNFSQVIAVDENFELFTRAWCVSEIAKSYFTGMKQQLKLLNSQALERYAKPLRNLRIQDMKASRREDVIEILSFVPDKDAFNKTLRSLLFHRLIPNWAAMDAREQMAVVGRICRWERVHFSVTRRPSRHAE